MKAKQIVPVTAAVRWLRERNVEFRPHFYRWEEHGGTRRASSELGVPEHQIVKTLVMETDGRKPLVVLMHGNREVSTQRLARFLGVKQVSPCDPGTAERYTGYRVGGISPFGVRKPMTIYSEETILDLPRVLINGGKRGFLIELESQSLREVLNVVLVQVAATDSRE